MVVAVVPFPGSSTTIPVVGNSGACSSAAVIHLMYPQSNCIVSTEFQSRYGESGRAVTPATSSYEIRSGQVQPAR
jgi:hypothetical protein